MDPTSVLAPTEAPRLRRHDHDPLIMQTAIEVKPIEVTIGIGALAIWLVLFIVGIFVPSWQARDDLLGARTEHMYRSLAILLIANAFPNTLLLTAASAFVGCMTRRWQVADRITPPRSNAEYFAPTRMYLSSLLRGFFLYLMFLGGFFLVTPSPETREGFINVDAIQYLRIAGILSVLGFVVGYDPNLLGQWMRRILKAADGSELQENKSKARDSADT